ncbi:hypothetical protein F5J12DRAFT_65835 [Pisolithus orientalis]|uniref:uncharacterized protein n=1 Tax=Pisolithus orientalis TaxID=936130 RepID=UPI002224EBDC|nr:uncharacterized protein F5J12DRAFT_65835 [Pisolithus orientalis]KAI6008162.1 hypothetical protein F5J12DRAFT_65835 [Pisolithus orientalis]
MESTDEVSRKRAELRRCPPGRRGRDDALFDLAWVLYEKFKKEHRIDDLNEAITLLRDVLELRPLGNHKRAVPLNSLAVCLSSRYDEQGEIDDLEEAIMRGRAVLELCPPGHPDRGAVLYDLACDLRTRFMQKADMHNLDEAIGLHRAALDLRPPKHPHRPLSLHGLALCLVDRFDNQGVVADFREAETAGRAGLVVRPPGHPDRGTADLDEAIAREQEAVQLLIPENPFYDSFRRSLTSYLQKKIRLQAPTPSFDSPPVASFDITQIVRNVALETLKTAPPRLLHTVTGTLCNRDTQISHFMGSQQYNQLQSSCVTCDPDQGMKLIHTEVLRYFRFVKLSHRWGEAEPSLRDIEGRSIYDMPPKGGLRKLQSFCTVVCEWDYLWAWSDTCCIDKHSSAEVQETIGSMFAWYRQSALTIVYLSDVPDTGSFGNSEWFKRGWTLQELLAPRAILFYTQNWLSYKNLVSSNHKADATVLDELERATGIESQFLTNFSPGMDDARSRLQWASLRRTTRPEDIAYSLFGIFDIHLPILYGESAENALGRLLAEIISQSGDISVLDWTGEASSYHSCFPAQISSYQEPPLPHVPMESSSRLTDQPVMSPAALRTLYRSLSKSPLPRFLSRRLTLPCIAYAVTAVQRRRTNPSAWSYTYRIQASGLKPLEITLPSKLENGALQLVRPWHSKLLGPSAELYTTTEEQLLFTLGRSFNALLLIEVRQNEYKRIASFTPITAQPVDSASILRSAVRIFDIV